MNTVYVMKDKEYSREEVLDSWNKVIAAVDKYYSKAKKVCNWDNKYSFFREFVFPKTKLWTFDILNKAVFNKLRSYDTPFLRLSNGCMLDGFGRNVTYFKLGENGSCYFDDLEDNKRYGIECTRFLNGNTRVRIFISEQLNIND